MTAPSPLGATLIESDRRYFELGADVIELEGAVVVSMEGLENLAGACVVQRVEPGRIVTEPEIWVRSTTEYLRDRGHSTARVYLVDPDTGLDGALVGQGFQKRLEIGYVSVRPLGSGRTDIVLRPMDGEQDWEAKRKLHAGSDTAADGHDASPEDWVDLEHRKCTTGGMQAFLVEAEGEVCGAVAVLDVSGVLRAKNLFVHPDRRREGIAGGVLRALSQEAARLGREAVGVFGVPGNPGDAVYRRLGMDPVVSQFEWCRSLSRG
ncbi:MAG TPA: GNAT family N-acetyltransferase [Acidimicrobiales bacterium]|nr:GNAT family N-acetyltransferase [Acidimicrobiales bacterium]